MKLKKSYFFVIFLIAGFAAQFLSVYGEKPNSNEKVEQFVLYDNLTEKPISEYCQKLRGIINDMATIFYLQYGAWEKEKEITVFFDIYRNGDLDEPSISFTKESENDKALRNLTVLTLKKTFSLSKMPFPKEIQSKKMKFKLKLLFKKEAGAKS